jgi:general secretion pathway protein G
MNSLFVLLPETPMRRCHTNSAFTLIEMLAVIAVIAILAAILIPAIGGIRAKAHSTQCRSNLRMLHQGVMLWAQDHDLQMPVLSTDPMTYWHRHISPYLDGPAPMEWKNVKPVPEFYQCPADEEPFSDVISYGMNMNFKDKRLPYIQNNPLLLADAEAVEIRTTSGTTLTYITASHHNGKCNYVRLDGSVHTSDGIPPPRLDDPDLWIVR